MKDYVLVLWSIIVMVFLFAVLYIGLYEKKNEEKLFVKHEIKEVVKKYIEIEDIKIEDSITVKFDTLKDEQYIEEIKYKNKNCIADTTINKYWIIKTYKINYTCK